MNISRSFKLQPGVNCFSCYNHKKVVSHGFTLPKGSAPRFSHLKGSVGSASEIMGSVGTSLFLKKTQKGLWIQTECTIWSSKKARHLSPLAVRTVNCTAQLTGSICKSQIYYLVTGLCPETENRDVYSIVTKTTSIFARYSPKKKVI